MLGNAAVAPMLPIEDATRAKAFYVDVLGLSLEWETPRGFAVRTREGAIYLYLHEKTKADHTAVRFAVDDVEAIANDLKSKGVTFEEYDEGDFKTVDGIVTAPAGGKAAWFKDTEGNLLSMVQTETAGK